MSKYDSHLKCSFCGKSQEQVRKLIAGPGVYICDECVDLCNEILDEELFDSSSAVSPPTPRREQQPERRRKAPSHISLNQIPKPREIKAYLDEHVIGQDEAKKVLSVAVYNHYKRLSYAQSNTGESGDEGVELQKSNILLMGPTGCGKTLLAQTLASILDVPFAVADATTLTEAGYVGEDVENILLRLLQVADLDVEEAQRGIIYIDEIDKIAVSDVRGGSVSREGVQRDLLPLIEGTTVSTKYGPMKTDHILFIASGAFHVAKPSDMLPELQGRLPIRVELRALTEADFVRILSETRANLVSQYKALLGTEKVELDITEDAIGEVAKIAAQVNESVENIGARRLQTVMEKLLEEISFEAEEHEGETITIDATYVQGRLSNLAGNTDLSKYIL